jgi:hypothetical protein
VAGMSQLRWARASFRPNLLRVLRRNNNSFFSKVSFKDVKRDS